jgi:hypothetical protein
MNIDQPVKLVEYQQGMASTGLKTYLGSDGDVWLTHEMGTMIRFPTFKLHPPTADEFNILYWKFRTPAMTYTIEPDAKHPANTWLYIVPQGGYDQSKLDSAARRNVKRAQKNLRIEFVSWDSLLKNGVSAYCDTRTRVGLSDGTPEGFATHFKMLSQIPGHTILGAWHGESLVAFMSLILVDDWVEIQGLFSANQDLDSRPNDGLFAHALNLFVVERNVSMVSYGLSSSQQVSNAVGLHRFKMKVGFQAKPVHRVFAVHPLIRPMVNPLSLVTLETLQKLQPKNRKIKKATGMLDILVNNKGLPHEDEEEPSESAATSTP